MRLALSPAQRDLIVVGLIVVVCTGLLGLIHGLSILQFFVNGIVVGSIYVLGATGLTLVYGIRKFANFAHGDMMTFGAYMAFLVNGLWLFDILWGFAFAVIITATLGIIMELLVFRKLANRGPVSALVASIGVTIFLQNFLNATFGTSISTYNIRLGPNVPLLVVDGVPVVSINPLRGVATLAIGVALIVFLHVLLKYTVIGKAMRATSDNPDLARASGIKVQRVVIFTWALSGALAGVAGVLLGIFIDVRPGLGFSVLLFVFAAVIVGGLGSPYGAMIGGFIVGIAQEMSAAFLVWIGNDAVARGIVDGLRSPEALLATLGIAAVLLAVAYFDAARRRDAVYVLGVLAYLTAWVIAAALRVAPAYVVAFGLAGTFVILFLFRKRLGAEGKVFALLLFASVVWIPAILALLAPPVVGGIEQPVAYRPIFAFAIMILVLLIRPGGLAAGKVLIPRVAGSRFRLRPSAPGAGRS